MAIVGGFLTSMTGLMQKEGPVVQAVVMAVDGSVDEITIDLTPRKDEITKVLEASATFVGQWSKQGVVLLCARDKEDEFQKNEGKLAFPFHELEEPVHGKILMIKMSEESEPLTFTKADFEVLVKEQEEAQKRKAEGIEDEEEEEEGNEEEEEEGNEEEEEEDEEEEDSDFEDEEDDGENEEEDDEEEEDEEEEDTAAKKRSRKTSPKSKRKTLPAPRETRSKKQKK